jgi:hypothetical protein
MAHIAAIYICIIGEASKKKEPYFFDYIMVKGIKAKILRSVSF